jgi:hypothetical protein
VIFLQDVAIPARSWKVNDDILRWGLDLEERLRLSNGHKAGLREWVGFVNQKKELP